MVQTWTRLHHINVVVELVPGFVVMALVVVEGAAVAAELVVGDMLHGAYGLMVLDVDEGDPVGIPHRGSIGMGMLPQVGDSMWQV